jgi:hypothetical protein
MIGISSSGHAVGTERGERLATPVPPDWLAKEKIELSARPRNINLGGEWRAAAWHGTTRAGLLLPETKVIEGEAEELEIETTFRRKLSGLRRLPKSERPSALKAARDWRQSALNALREKHARERHANHLLRNLQILTPG